MRLSTPRVFVIATFVAFLMYGSAFGQQCANYGGMYYDVYPQDQTVTCMSRSQSLYTATFSGNTYAFQIEGCGFSYYPVSGATVAAGSSTDPYGSSSAYAHNEARLRHIAVLDDFPYGIVSQSSEGWALFKIDYTSRGISSISQVSRFYFGDNNVVDPGNWLYAAKLYRANGHVYAIGHWLDGTNLDNAHFALGIYDLGTGSTTPPMTKMATIPVPSYERTSMFDIVYGSSGTALYIYTSTGVDIFDVSVPSAPTFKSTNTDPGFAFASISTSYGPNYPRGTAVATVTEGGSQHIKLYTYPATNVVYIYDVTNPFSPTRKNNVTIANGPPVGSGIACDGKLLAMEGSGASGDKMVRYFSVAADTLQELSHSINWSTSDPAYSLERVEDVALVPPTTALPNSYKVLRSYFERSFWDTVSTSCLNTTPTAGVTVTRASTTGTPTCSGSATHGGDVLGFPGDSFTITNGSTGIPTPTIASIVVTGIDGTAGNTAYTSGDISGQLVGGAVAWVAPTGLTGEFQVTLTINESATPAVGYVYLCNNPSAALVVSQYMAPGGAFQTCNNCGWLSGYTLRLSGTGSAGNPDWAASQWTVEFAPKATPTAYAPLSSGFTNNQNGTLDLPLTSVGNYRVTLDPAYAFSELQPDPTAQLVIPSGAVTATIVATQNNLNVPNGGTVLVASPLSLAWSGQCATTCTYAWTGVPCVDSTSSTCNVNANTLNSQPYSVGLTATDSGGDSAAASFGFTANNCIAPGVPTTVSPANGASVSAGAVTLQWSQPTTGTGPFTYTVRDALGTNTYCGPGLGQTSCSISVTAGTNVTWRVTASNACGDSPVASSTFSVSGGSCTSPGTPSLSSPSDAASVAAGSVSFSWGAVSGSPTITYNVKNAFGATLCSTTGTSCSASLTSGNVQWHVEAGNSCGTSVSSTRTLTVTGGGQCTTLGTPVLQSPANGGSAQVSGNGVVVTWGAVSGTSPSYTVVYAGGISQACAGTTSTSCTIPVTTQGASVSWWVMATDACGGTTSSAHWTFTIGATCTAPATPVSLNATPNGNVVTLSWSAVSGTTPITYTAQTTLGATLCTATAPTTSCSFTATQSQYTWLVRASNSCGNTPSTTASFTVNLCAQTAVPVADFTMNPAQDSTVTVGGYVQKQPYTRQVVNFQGTGTNNPTSWAWQDFQELGLSFSIPNPSVTWTQAGGKTVRVWATNCFGTSQQTVKTVTVYADNRPVIADFTLSPFAPNVGDVVTFTAKTGPQYGDPDTFTWKFDDEATTRTGATMTRQFTCGGPAGVTLTASSSTRGKSASTKLTGVISGTPLCCVATAPPVVPAFTWSPNGALSFQSMQQQQPYVNQTVTFSIPTPSTATAWSWEIAIQPSAGSPTVIKTDASPTYVFPGAGSYTVKLTASNCAGSAATVTQSVTVYADVRPVTAAFTCSPSTPAVGATATCTASTGFNYGDPDSFNWTFPGNVKKTGNPVQFAFACGGANSVTLISNRGATASQATTKTVTTTGTPSCCKPPNRAGTPVPASGTTVPGGTVVLQWARPTQGTDPLRYDVYLDGVKLPACTDLTALQCSTSVADGTTFHQWKVVAKNDCGDTTTYPDTPPVWTFKACSASAKPDAVAFTWSPSSPTTIGGVTQQQPYVGQPVTFSYTPSAATAATSWYWTDYQVAPANLFYVANPVVTYASAGDKKMRMRATNCAGTTEITLTIHVYDDVRPVVASFHVSPETPNVLEPVTFTFDNSDEFGNPTQFIIDFGDGTQPKTTTDLSVMHAYGCGKLYRPTVTAQRVKVGKTTTSAPNSRDLTVSGTPCAPLEAMIVDMVNQAQSSDGLAQQGNLVVFNSTGSQMSLDLAVRDKDTKLLATGLHLPTLPPQGSIALSDIMAQTGLSFSTATLWFKRTDGGDTLPVINAWQYIQAPDGARYYQFLPVISVWPASDQTTSHWITGLIHNGVNAERSHTGFVSKLTFIDPTRDNPDRTPWGGKTLGLTLYDNQTGAMIKTDSLNLDDPKFAGYWQDYVNGFFHLAATQDLKAITVEITVPAGISVEVLSSMFDNASGHAVVFPSQTAP
jgi:PKD repeat protein